MILLIDNYDSFTWNLVQRLGEIDPSLEPGLDLVVARNDRITPEEAASLDGGRGPTHVIISPGPCTPTESGVSGAIIDRFAGRVPVLGVCLGHQTMAAGTGLVVERHSTLMHGKTSPVEHDGCGVFAGLPSPFEATRYHSLVVRTESMTERGVDDIPGERTGDQWKVSAHAVESDGTRVIMGLRRVWAEAAWPDGAAKSPLEGVQFHPESFLTVEGPRILANFLAMG